MTARVRPSTLLVGMLALLLAGFLLLDGGWSLSNGSLWAFSFLSFVPVLLRIGLALLLLIVSFAVLVMGGEPSRQWSPRLRQLPLWPIALVGGLFFWLLRERTYHGDALLKLKLLAGTSLQGDPYIWKEPLDSLLAHSASDVANLLGQPPEVAVALFSVLAGVLYLWSVLYVARLLGRTPWTALLIVFALLATGSSQLWYGHIENYSLVTSVCFLSIVLAVGYLRGDKPLWPVGLTGGTAVSLHPQAVFTLPALLLLLDRRRWKRQIGTLLLTGLVVPVLTVLLLLLAGAPLPGFDGGYAGDPQLFWTPAQALAPAQLWQAVNNLWLLVPLFPLWLAAGVWALIDGRTRRDRVLLYLTAVAAGLLLYHFSFQNDLPRWRDWDLFAIVGPGVTLWGVYAWSDLMAVSSRKREWMWPLVTICLIFATLLTGAWIGVNHRLTLIRPNSEEREIYRRYKVADVVDLLPQATVFPPEPLCEDAVGCERVAATEFTMPHNGDTRPTIFAHAPARILLPLTVPERDSFLWLSPALDPDAWDWGGDGVTFSVAVQIDEAQGEPVTLWSQHYTPSDPAHRDWQQAIVPLSAYSGQTIALILETSPGMAGDNAGDRAGWGLPWLMEGTYDDRFGEE